MMLLSLPVNIGEYTILFHVFSQVHSLCSFYWACIRRGTARLADTCSSNDLVLYPVHKQDEPLEYVYSREQSIHLPGAHGKEIVRDILTDPHVSID